MTKDELKALCERQNSAMNRIRAGGAGYQAYVTSAHIEGAYGGSAALTLQIGFETVRKQAEDFAAEVEGWETNAVMIENRTPVQKAWAWISGVRPLAQFNVSVVIY